MLQVARLAPNLLLEAGPRVVEFLLGQLNGDGGGKDRDGKSDLYYTAFCIEGLLAMRVDPPADRVRKYLESFGDGGDLDFVHLCCLVRCWASIGGDGLGAKTRMRMAERIASFRRRDGGFNPTPGETDGTVYHSFLALGAWQDLEMEIPQLDRLAESVAVLQTQDGAYGNEKSLNIATTPTTAAAATLLRHCSYEVSPRVGAWLKSRCHESGGFLAIPGAPMPDLLSTATALHALAGLHVPLEDIQEKCLDFVDSLWTGRAFCGSWEDDAQDSEYTYYALLALGHLSL